MVRAYLASLALAASLATTPVVADDTAKVAELQTVMQRHIDQMLVDGAMHSVDFETGQVVQFYPTEAHTMVMGLGDDYVLCSDLMNKDGKSVPVDFYVTPTADGYAVYQTEINNRGPLQKLIKQGLVERIR